MLMLNCVQLTLINDKIIFLNDVGNYIVFERREAALLRAALRGEKSALNALAFL
jgi:hypothetical protein